MIKPPDIDELLPLLRLARDEDLGSGDITTEATVPPEAEAIGALLAKGPGVLCGTVLLEPLAKVYEEFTLSRGRKGGSPASSQVRIELDKRDGERMSAGEMIGRLIGPARSLLAIERVALNFLQRLSGVATLTRAFVDAVAGTRAQILDTRKTTPGWRLLEKYAVRCGGGANHRVGLFDAILVKDNHIALGQKVGMPLSQFAIDLRRRCPDVAIEIEVDTLDQLGQLLAAPAGTVDIILLDNMSVEQMASAVRMRDERVVSQPGVAASPLMEASGGVTLATVRAIAETGVERISVGGLTHSARAVDISLEISSAIC